MKKHLLAAAVAATTALASSNASASGIPTVDVANLAQSIVGYVTQIEQLSEAATQVQQGIQAIEEARRQVEEAQRAYDSLNGIRDLGSLLNSDLYKDSRDFLPTDWRQVLELSRDVEGGRYSSLKDALEAVKRGARIYERDDIKLSADAQPMKQLDQAELTNANEIIVAGASYEKAVERRRDLQQFVDRINTSADQKSTLDLIARIQAENAMLQNEVLAAMAQQQLAEAKRVERRNQQRERKLYLSHLPYDAEASVRSYMPTRTPREGE